MTKEPEILVKEKHEGMVSKGPGEMRDPVHPSE